ncbi:MAG: CCA tRNA nucleotidyltransferase [bacterium]|nr:CCA tRNA nucleotidyltransferase [bacterium]
MFIQLLINDILIITQKLEMKAYAIGGSVRDLMLDSLYFKHNLGLTGKVTYINFPEKSKIILQELVKVSDKDLDLMLKGDAILLGKKLEIKGYKIRFNHKFKTINILDFSVDVTTMRSEIYQKSGALPLVAKGTMETDLKRRDLTINAMAMSLNKESFGEIIDLYSGVSDLRNRVARVLYDQSFSDDPTRIFRVIRFSARFSLVFSNKTEQLLKAAVMNKVYNNISKDRILNEFKKIFSEEKKVIIKILHLLNEFSLLDIIHHNIKINYQKFKENKILSCNWFVWFLLLMENLGKDDVEKVVGKFNFSRKEIKLLLNR